MIITENTVHQDKLLTLTLDVYEKECQYLQKLEYRCRTEKIDRSILCSCHLLRYKR